MTLMDRLQQILKEINYERSRNKGTGPSKSHFSFFNQIKEDLNEMDEYLGGKLQAYEEHKKR